MFEFANTVEASRIYSRTRLTPRSDAVAKAAAIGDGCPARQSAPASRQQRIDKRPAGHRGANSWNQSCGRGALEDEATHAGGQRLLQMGFVFVGGQDQNLDRGSLLANLSRKDDPVHPRHADVDHRHIRVIDLTRLNACKPVAASPISSKSGSAARMIRVLSRCIGKPVGNFDYGSRLN